jgi:hypothetical protein
MIAGLLNEGTSQTTPGAGAGRLYSSFPLIYLNVCDLLDGFSHD